MDYYDNTIQPMFKNHTQASGSMSSVFKLLIFIIFILILIVISKYPNASYTTNNIFFVARYFFYPSQYIQEKIQKNIENSRIVVSLTTSPDRIYKIKPVLDSIMNQVIVPSKIYLNLPHVFKRTGKQFDKIPEFITSNPIIFINKCEDIGPATKIIPTLEYEKDPETIIISIDDDILYYKNVINTFMHYSLKYPQSCITGTSFIDSEYNVLHKKLPFFSRIYYSQFLEGYSGVLYKVKFFNNFVLDYITESPKACFLADDLMLSNYLLKNKIPILSIEIRNYIKPLNYGLEKDALHNDNSNNVNYAKCLQWLKTKNDSHFKNIKQNSRVSFISSIE
jgi:hypothetical protein